MGQASRRKKVARPKGELMAALQQQLRFLERSADAFDEGDEAEAVRMAVTLRVLLHDTEQSKSLLKSLKLKRDTKFLDTGADLVESEDLGNGVRRDAVRLDGSVLTYVTYGAGEIGVAPLLGEHRPDIERWLSFTNWWTRPVLSSQPGQFFEDGPRSGPGASRGDLVRWLANEDGAHVDERLTPMHSTLTREYRARFHINRLRHPTPAYAAVRQVTYEVLETMNAVGFRASVPDLRQLGDAATS